MLVVRPLRLVEEYKGRTKRSASRALLVHYSLLAIISERAVSAAILGARYRTMWQQAVLITASMLDCAVVGVVVLNQVLWRYVVEGVA